jgi:hypothetical protein
VSRFDPLLMHAVITRVEAERPVLDLDLVVALYHHLTGLDGPQPTFEALLEYLDRVEPWLGEGGLRELLGLAPDAPRRRRAAEWPGGDSPEPGRGRPRGTGQLTASAVRAAHEAFRVERGRRPTQAELASRLDVATRSLQRFLHDHCLGWPLEG